MVKPNCHHQLYRISHYNRNAEYTVLLQAGFHLLGILGRKILLRSNIASYITAGAKKAMLTV